MKTEKSLHLALFGIEKDGISSFVTDSAVRRFLLAGNILLEEATWEGIPRVNRIAVEPAADGLGLLIEELRVKFRVLEAPFYIFCGNI